MLRNALQNGVLGMFITLLQNKLKVSYF